MNSFKSLIAATVVLSCFPLIAHAQIVNVQDLFINQTGEGLRLGMTTKGEFKSGNVDYAYLYASLLGRYLKGKHTLLATANIEYAEKSKDSFTNRHFEHFRYRYAVLNPIGFEIFTQHEFNEFRRISNRILLGTGVTWRILKTRMFYLFAGSDYMYEYNRLSDGEFADSGELWKFHRWDNYLTFQFIPKKGMKFLTTIYYQPDLENFSDYNLLADTDLSISLNKWLSLVVSYNFSRQNNPPEGVKKTDNVLLVGFAFKLGPYLKN
ncbi:MAG: DUF481 domain-containing protein [Deltaproteobacteria bacterium]|nr:DUF481 domain-containing protein [Deltaproteobacteria bacterium]